MKTITLTERTAVTRRLPRADVEDLLARFPHVVELAPTADTGVYRLTARGWAGTFRTRTRRWHIRPKLGWAAVRTLLHKDPTQPTGGSADVPVELAAVLATRLGDLMTAVSAAGLAGGYAEADVESATVRGRIDIPGTARAEARGVGRLRLTVDEFTTDVPWNQLPATAARRLLAFPGLPPVVRAGLAAALRPFDDVSDFAPAPDGTGPRPEGPAGRSYGPLLRWAEVVLAALGSGWGEAVLINLEHLFQVHVADLLAGRGRRGRVVHAQQLIRLAADSDDPEPLRLIPDLVVRDGGGAAVSVWDTKWKRPGPALDPADAHQVLAYAAALGVSRAGLIYPGLRFAARTYRTPAVRLTVLTHRLTGDPARARRSAARLARAVFRTADRSDGA